MTIFGWVLRIYNTLISLAASCASGFSALSRGSRELSDEQDRQLQILAEISKEQMAQRGMLERILAAVEPGPVAAIAFNVLFEGQITQGAMHMQLNDSQKFDFSVSPVDAKGNPSSVDPSKTTASIDDTTVATVTANADGLTGTVTALKPGKTQLQVSVTDANNPNDTVKGALDIEVLAGDTATVTIGTSAPAAQ